MIFDFLFEQFDAFMYALSCLLGGIVLNDFDENADEETVAKEILSSMLD